MYRAITLKVLTEKLDLRNKAKIVELARSSTIRLKDENGCTKVFLDDRDVTEKIRTPAVTRAVSTVSGYEEVREVMVREQRNMAAKGAVVLEGRDIGTVVLPNAELKIFMNADVDERVRRRKKDLEMSGIDIDIQDVKVDLEARDHKDTTRTASPLRKAAGSIELDTSNLTIQEQVDFIVERAKKIINTLE